MSKNLSTTLLLAAGALFIGILVLLLVNQLSVYETISSELVLLGLVGLGIYVQKTSDIAEATHVYVQKTIEIAKATSEHNDIITRPAVTVNLVEDSPLNHVGLLVKNHSDIHANIKIKIDYAVAELEEDITVRISTPIVTGAYSGKEVWNVPAKYDFFGHTELDGLTDRKLGPFERVILNVRTETSPYGKDTYRADPPLQYWRTVVSERWIPNPVPEN